MFLTENNVVFFREQRTDVANLERRWSLGEFNPFLPIAVEHVFYL
jgi:hypothetical protein